MRKKSRAKTDETEQIKGCKQSGCLKNIKLKLINVLLQNKGPALTLHFLKFNQTFSKFRIRCRKLYSSLKDNSEGKEQHSEGVGVGVRGLWK